MKRINLKFKIIIMFLLLFLMFPISVSAGKTDFEKTDETNKNIINDEAKEMDVITRLNQYCSFYSSGWAFGSAYSGLDQIDENSINGYAKLLDTTTGGRGAVRDSVEAVEDYQGYMYYDIKITTSNEADAGEHGYSRRTYYKYIQLKKEDRTFNNTNYSFGGASTGIWLYYSNDQVADSNRDIQTELEMIDVFTGTSLGSEITPYWEQIFMWPVSSKGVGVAADMGGSDAIVNAISQHDPTSYEVISTQDAFCLAFFQRRNTNTEGVYLQYNSKYGCSWDVTIPSYSTLISQIVAVTGHNAYYNYPRNCWFYKSSGKAGLKNKIVTNGSLGYMDNRVTYTDYNGRVWPTYFLQNPGDGLRYNTSTAYSFRLEEMGSQFDLLNGLDSDVFVIHHFHLYPTIKNPTSHPLVSKGWVNSTWEAATNNGTNLANAPREVLRTLQVFLKTTQGALAGKFIGWAKAERSEGYGRCTGDILNNLTLQSYNSYCVSDPQLALDILTVLFEGGRYYSEWYDYASDGLYTSMYVSRGGFYKSFRSGIVAEKATPPADKLMLGDGNKLQIVDLFRAFGVSDAKAYDFIQEYRKDPFNAKIPGLNEEKNRMILTALNNEDNSTIVLTNAEISKGLVKTSDINEELYTGFIPYVAVLTKNNETGFRSYGTKDSEIYIPPYDGNNASEIVDAFYNLSLSDASTLGSISKSTGVALFENIFMDETHTNDLKTTFVFQYSKNRILGTTEKALTYQEFESLENGAMISAVSDSAKFDVNNFKRMSGILSSDNVNGKYTEIITVKSTQSAEEILKYANNGYLKDVVKRKQNSVRFFATFCIDAYSAELVNGSLYENQRETLDVYRQPLTILPSKLVISNIVGATRNHTKSINIHAVNSGKYHSDNYAVGEGLSIDLANSGLGTFGSLFNTLVYGNFVDSSGYVRKIYGDFISNAKKLRIEIVSVPFANFGYKRSEEGIVTLYLTQAQMDDLNNRMVEYTKQCINNGYLKGLTISEFESMKETIVDSNNILLMNWLSLVFDRNSVCTVYGFVPETPEDLIVSDTTKKIDKTNSNGTSNSECRDSINWFSNKTKENFNITAVWQKDGTDALDSKEKTVHTIKNDLRPKHVDDKIALFYKNYELTYPTDSRVITGTLSVGRVPESQLKGLRIGDFRLIIFEELLVNETEWQNKNKSFNSLGSVLSSWYNATNPNSYSKSMVYSLFSDTYSKDVLFNKYNSSSKGLLNNLNIKPVSYQRPEEEEIKVLRNEVVGKLTLGETQTPTNIEDVEWAAGMVVNYEYSYCIPYGSEKTSIQYISNLAGTQYNNNFVNNKSYQGLYAINDALIRFALVPKTDSNGNLIRYDNTQSSGAMGYNRNNYNDETFIYADVPSGGNMSWIDDESIYVELTANGKVWGKLIPYTNIDDISRTIEIPDNVLTELNCIDESGNLVTPLNLRVQPILRYDNFVYGRYAPTFHYSNAMEINVDNRITSDNTNLNLSTLNASVEAIGIDQDDGNSYLAGNNTLSAANIPIGNKKLSSTYIAQLDIGLSFKTGDCVIGAEHINEIILTVPGTEISGCSSASGPRCKSDNTISEDWEYISIKFCDSNLTRDNVVQDIIVYDNSSVYKDVLGENNYGQTPGAQSLVSPDRSKWLSTNLGIYAVVERVQNLGPANVVECTPLQIGDIQVGHFEISYTANGVDYTQSTTCIVSSGAGTYSGYYATNILEKVGDKLVFAHNIQSLYPISELTVKFEYRTCYDTNLSYDNLDSNMANNVRSETWDSGIDVTAEIISVPSKITKQGQYACNLDENGDWVLGSETITGTLETSSFEANALITAFLTNDNSKDIINDLNMKYTLFMYAEHNGKKIYPTSISGAGITGSYYNGKAHMLLRQLGEYNVTAQWENVKLGEGQVKIQVEIWPIPSLDSANAVIYNNFPNISQALYGKDVYDADHPSVLETDPYKPGTLSSNNKDNKSFNVSYTSKKCSFACDKNDDFLANEARWTVKFKWTNFQNGIADWTSINESSQEMYNYDSSLTNINYEFYENLGAPYVDSKEIRNGSWAQTDGIEGSYYWQLKKYGGGIYRGVDLTKSSNQIYYIKKEVNITYSNRYSEEIKTKDEDGKEHIESIEHTDYKGTWHEIESFQSINGIRYGSVNTCRHETGPDNNIYNWGPNGLTEGSSSRFINGGKLPDEVDYTRGAFRAVSKFNTTSIPLKYWNYIYSGGELVGSTAPRTNNNDSIHNWDSLSSTSYYDSTYAGGLAYHFYSEKVTASVQVASSRDNFVWHDPGSWTVYNGESFKVRGKIVYEVNTFGNYPRSPVQDIEVSQYETIDLYTKYKEKGKAGFDNGGFYIYTEKVEKGKIVPSSEQKIYIAVFDSNSVKVVDGVGNYTKSWKRTGNSAWTPNEDNVDRYEGKMKTWYTGQRLYGAYDTPEGTSWMGVDSRWNLFRFLKNNYNLKNYEMPQEAKDVQKCNSLAFNGNIAGAGKTIYAEYSITGTSSFNKFVIRLSDDSSSSRNKTIHYWNILPGYDSSQDAITVPLTNVSQNIKIQFNAFPFKGNGSNAKYHPYNGANDEQHDNRYLCDVSSYTIKIRPTGNIIGDVTNDDDIEVNGDGGWKEEESNGSAGIY